MSRSAGMVSQVRAQKDGSPEAGLSWHIPGAARGCCWGRDGPDRPGLVITVKSEVCILF